MTEIKLTPEKEKTGYDAVAKYIRRYWDYYRKIAPVLVSITTSYDGETWDEWKPI